MANPELEKLVREQLEELPPSIKEAIRKTDLRTQFDRIREKNHLHIDEAAELENETILLMLGFESPEEYEKRVSEILRLAPEAQQVLLNDVNELIFLPIQEMMRIEPETVSQPAEEPPKAPTREPETEPLEKEKLLAEIENPEKLLPAPAKEGLIAAPTSQPAFTPAPPASAASIVTPPKPEQSAPTTPTSVPVVSPSRPFSFPSQSKTSATETPAPIYEQKLTEPTKTVRQEAQFTIRRSSIDPYREPPE